MITNESKNERIPSKSGINKSIRPQLKERKLLMQFFILSDLVIAYQIMKLIELYIFGKKSNKL